LSGKQLRDSVDKWIVDLEKTIGLAWSSIYFLLSSGTKVFGEIGERS
jgi:hypothetical protein